MGLTNRLFDRFCRYLSADIQSERHAYLCDFDRICHEIIPGDVLLIEGTNRVSKIIKNITCSPWTHSALYVGRLHSIEKPVVRERVREFYHGSASSQLLVESLLGQGTIVTPIKEYSEHHIRICRPTGLSHSDAQKVISYAIEHLGRDYDTRHILDLARFLMANRWFIPSRWRSSLFAKDPGQMSKDICSTLIAEAFASINFPVLPLVREDDKNQLEMIHRNAKLFTPSDFDYSPYFSIIKYPIFHFASHAPYHNLPWREGLESQDRGVVTEREESAASGEESSENDDAEKANK